MRGCEGPVFEEERVNSVEDSPWQLSEFSNTGGNEAMYALGRS